MDTLSSARTCHSTEFRLATSRGTEFLDFTACLERFVAETGISTGTLNIQTRHTTTAIVVNEHEPLLLADFERLLEQAAPRAAIYAHDDLGLRSGIPADEPRNGHAHCRALLLPSSTTLNVIGGRIALGRWQRVFLVELDGPRQREVSVVIVGEAAR
jgi:secondary thiamine-phosphate synthase enzyme